MHIQTVGADGVLRELYGTSSFPVAITRADAKTGIPSPARFGGMLHVPGGYSFGLDRKQVSDHLRALADGIDGGTVLLHSASESNTAGTEDWQSFGFAMTYAAQFPEPVKAIPPEYVLMIDIHPDTISAALKLYCNDALVSEKVTGNWLTTYAIAKEAFEIMRKHEGCRVECSASGLFGTSIGHELGVMLAEAATVKEAARPVRHDQNDDGA